MHLNPQYIQVLPRLANTGSTEYAQGVLQLTSIDIGHRHFDVPKGIAYDVSLANTSEAVLLSGTATASLQANCDRCLEPAELTISGEVQGYYLFDPAELASDEKLEVYEFVDSDGRIDIAPPILASIVFEIPTVTLCRPDCEGVLSQSAEGSNGIDGLSSEHQTDEINPESPFAALKDFKFEE